MLQFQSLKREIGHLADKLQKQHERAVQVSIPQAGNRPFSRDSNGKETGKYTKFQSLKREIGHLARYGYPYPKLADRRFNPSSGKSAI